jgi:hypothetical protein
LSGPRKPPKGAESITIDPDLLAELEAMPNTSSPWTDEMDEVLRRFYRSKGPTQLASIFTERYHKSRMSMQKRASMLGLTRKA